METLTPRQEQILAIVVREYVRTATPVGSRTVVERGNLNVSPATVRNEMAALEEAGYLTHPHTSAGRVPTEAGYRYFVQRLMGETYLPSVEQRMIRHQFHQARLGLEEWIRLSATMTARLAHAAALVTAPRPEHSHFKHLELISTHGSLVLLIVVLQGGRVEQRMLSLADPLSQEELGRVSNRLNQAFAGLTSAEIEQSLQDLSPFEQEVARIVVEIMRYVEAEHIPIYHDGLAHVLTQPEFAETEYARQLVQVIEEGQIIRRVLDELLDVSADGVQILIGGEGRWKELANYSLVLSCYGVHGYAIGALGVLGPIRMPYDRAVSVVRYMAGLLSDLIYEIYGL